MELDLFLLVCFGMAEQSMKSLFSDCIYHHGADHLFDILMGTAASIPHKLPSTSPLPPFFPYYYFKLLQLIEWLDLCTNVLMHI